PLARPLRREGPPPARERPRGGRQYAAPRLRRPADAERHHARPRVRGGGQQVAHRRPREPASHRRAGARGLRVACRPSGSRTSWPARAAHRRPAGRRGPAPTAPRSPLPAPPCRGGAVAHVYFRAEAEVVVVLAPEHYGLWAKTRLVLAAAVRESTSLTCLPPGVASWTDAERASFLELVLRFATAAPESAASCYRSLPLAVAR